MTMDRSAAVLGLDIGGANLKAAHTDGTAQLVPFALWKDPAGLAPALASLRAALPPADMLAVTMTGELCDCFETKRAGVHAILEAVETVAAGTRVCVWRTDGTFTDTVAARATPLATAAANWLALATFAGRFVPAGPTLLLDVGSTTSDIVPLEEGQPTPAARTDPERLRCGELVYTGVRRTPVAALLEPPVAAELFATSHDAYLLLGQVPEAAHDRDTADGRPATRRHAHARLARMLCADVETCTEAEALALAQRVRRRQLDLLGQALRRVALRLSAAPRGVVVAGSGEFLARALIAEVWPGIAVTSLASYLGPSISASACAYAVALLARERGHA